MGDGVLQGSGCRRAWRGLRSGTKGRNRGHLGIPVRQEDEMRRHAIGAVAVAVFAVPVLGGTSALAVQPSAGIYNTLQYVVSATPSPSTATCPNKAVETLGGYLKYPGPGA